MMERKQPQRLAGATGGRGRMSAAAAALAATQPAPREERPRHLRVVDPARLTIAQRRRRARLILVCAIAAATFVAFALVYVHVLLAQRQFRLDNLGNQIQTERSTYENLRLQVAQLGSPQHIVSMAEGKLGMVQPAKVIYLAPAAPSKPATTTAGPPGRSSPASG